MNNRICLIALPLALAACSTAPRQAEEINDTNNPLHLLKPDYVTPYGELSQEDVKASLDRVFHYIDSVTPPIVYDADGKVVTDYSRLSQGAHMNQGTFRLGSYEWGVTYQALLDAARITGEQCYKDYVTTRLRVMAECAPAFGRLIDDGGTEPQMRQVARPRTLDDAGAMASAAMRAQLADGTLGLGDMVERYFDILAHHTYRLPDGTIARTRPHRNAVWLDDMYMAIPAMVSRATYTGDEAWLDSAATQTLGFARRMWLPEKGLFRHGYVEGLETQPDFHWARANGWAILTLCQVLDALPDGHPARAEILGLYRAHVKSLAALQTKDGFWHQLLDRNDSYEETSATAIYAYCMAHGINEGWIDPVLYGPVAQLAWEAVSTKINGKGEVEGTCVGTGMGFDPAFYCYRPVSAKAAHGYGPVIYAAAEMIRLLQTQHPRSNDSAIHYYRTDPENTDPIFSIDEEGKAETVLH